jgi:hypothetical protein
MKEGADNVDVNSYLFEPSGLHFRRASTSLNLCSPTCSFLTMGVLSMYRSHRAVSEAHQDQIVHIREGLTQF